MSAFPKAGIAVLLLCPALAAAQSAYPHRPIRMIVPFAPGGAGDFVARILQPSLTEILGQQVIVENRPGAAGNIGVEVVANASNDGHTLLLGNIGAIAINPNLYTKFPVKPLRDLAAISQVVDVPGSVSVHPSLPVKSVPELIAHLKSRPGQLNFASGSTGSAGHLAGELFNSMAGVRMTHIPYKGAAPAVVDLMAGHVSLMFDNMSSALPNIKATRVRALAVTTLKRSPLLPQLPTISDAGLRGFDIATWFGIFAPAGAPPDSVARLNGEIVRILHTPEMKERLALLGAEPIGNKPDEFAAFVRAEIPKYAKVIQASGARADY